MNLHAFLRHEDALNFINRPIMRIPPSKESEVAAASALTTFLASHPAPHCLFPQRLPASQPQQPRELQIPQRFTKNGRKRAVPFPLKLMKVLSTEEYSHVITWMPGGRSFVVIRPKAFVADILPKHFKSAQFASFTRKLARWGFSRCEDGTGEFYHPQFRRGRIDLAERMTCQTGLPSKSSEAKASEEERDAQTVDRTPVAEKKDDEAASVAAAQKTGSVTDSLCTNANKEQALALELEAMRLHQCILAAAVSRKALATMQGGAFGVSRGNQAFPLSGGFSEMPSNQMDASRGFMLENRMQLNALFGGFATRANIRGAKMA